MKKKLSLGFLTGLFMLCLSGVTQATILYDQNVTPDVIFGSGNANGYFAVDTENNIEVGLRAKLRKQGVYNSDGLGTYSFDAGPYTYTGFQDIAMWNYEFSINVNLNGLTTDTLDDYDVYLLIDTDASLSINWVTLNPFAVWDDNALGYNTTSNGGGDDSATANTNYGDYYVAQNSQNLTWTLGSSLFDYNVSGTYDFALFVTEKDKSPRR